MTPEDFPGRLGDVNLLERLEWVLEEKGWKPGHWARLAGLKERTHVNTIMRRLRDKPESTLDMETAAKLAMAADVSLDWLALGRGSPAGLLIKPESDPRYPTRATAVVGARIFGWNESAVAKVLAVDGFSEDPGLDYWLALLKAEHEGSRKLLPPPSGASRGKRGPTSKRRQ